MNGTEITAVLISGNRVDSKLGDGDILLFLAIFSKPYEALNGNISMLNIQLWIIGSYFGIISGHFEFTGSFPPLKITEVFLSNSGKKLFLNN